MPSKVEANSARSALKGRFAPQRVTESPIQSDSSANATGNVFNPELLREAEAALKALKEDYTTWIKNDIAAIVSDCAGSLDSEVVARIGNLAHEIKGQGASFGFPLITAIAQSLYEFCVSLEAPCDRHVGIIRTHTDAMARVIDERLGGHRGKDGREILRAINDVRVLG